LAGRLAPLFVGDALRVLLLLLLLLLGCRFVWAAVVATAPALAGLARGGLSRLLPFVRCDVLETATLFVSDAECRVGFVFSFAGLIGRLLVAALA